MDNDALDLSKYKVLEDTLNSNGIRRLSVLPVNPVVICPGCSETELIIKKDLTHHTVYDVYGNKPVEVEIIRQRYRCKGCGCTFTSSGDPYAPRSHVTQAFGDYLSQKILQDGSLTYTAIKDLYGISQTYVSEALSLYAKEMDKLIISMQPCYRLIFYPFTYEKLIRCCICGTDDSDRNVILGILDDYSADSIKDFINTKVSSSAVITVFCALIPDIVTMLHDVLPEAEVVINPISIQRRINALIEDTGDGLYNPKTTLLDKLKALLKKQYENYEGFYSAFNNQWKETIPIELKPLFRELVTDFSDCLPECYNSSHFKENEFDISTVMDTINNFRKHNVPYGIMCLRILFVNPYVVNQVKASQYGNYMNDVYGFKRFGIENYAIDIKMLPKWFSSM